MPSVDDLLAEMRSNPHNVKFRDAVKVAEAYFGPPRIRGSHRFFSMPWRGDPLVNLQRTGNLAKPYQVRQLIAAIDRLKEEE